MSADKYVTIWCDACGDVHYQHWSDNTREARQLVKEGGWKRVGGRDLCPRCAPREEGEANA